MTRKSSANPRRAKLARGRQYPDAHGRTVDWIEHVFEEGILLIRVRFADQTELCWSIRSATVIREADLCDWRTGSEKRLKVYVRGESD
jgi:hypothetical protein